MTRVRLPDRRAAETVKLEHGGQPFTITVGFYPDGRPGEVFTHGARSGSNLDALLAYDPKHQDSTADVIGYAALLTEITQ